jgi:hypothetical protein
MQNANMIEAAQIARLSAEFIKGWEYERMDSKPCR